ncbi:hypothetical protein [Ferruginibacter sp.]|nr:hypothetical protein [Ferruginibacter sp.]
MQNNLQRTYNEITKSTKLKIEATEDSEIIGCKTDSLIEYFFFLNFFSPIEIDDKKPQTISKRTGFQIPQDVPKDLLDTKKDFTTESLIYFLPIKPNLRISEIIGFHPFKDSSKNIQWGTSDIQIVFPVKGYGFIKDEIQVASEVEIKRKLVVEWIEKINTQIINFNEYLRSEIKLCIEKRKKEIELNDEKYKNISKRINIPLQLKIDDTIQKIQLDTSPLIKNIKPSPNVVEEYILDRKKVLDIVHVLDNQGRQFEKTAMTYKSMYEEDLRNILLVSL